jgi:creatinine amidohydrolase
VSEPVHLAELTTEEIAAVVAGPPTAVLLPVGSVEPHGPHLPLATDTLISDVTSRRAAAVLRSKGVSAWIAPAVAYGVTDFAAGFAGTVGVDAPALTAFLTAIAARFVEGGWSHVCLVNNHLEPAHDQAVRAAIAGLPKGRASVACPLTRRWGRTLSEEFKRGNCHAGRYETSLVLACGGRVREAERAALEAIGVSLSEGIRAGKTTFRQMGLERAYTGAPAEGSAAEGEELLARLVDMVVGEVVEGLSESGMARNGT